MLRPTEDEGAPKGHARGSSERYVPARRRGRSGLRHHHRVHRDHHGLHQHLSLVAGRPVRTSDDCQFRLRILICFSDLTVWRAF